MAKREVRRRKVLSSDILRVREKVMSIGMGVVPLLACCTACTFLTITVDLMASSQTVSPGEALVVSILSAFRIHSCTR